MCVGRGCFPGSCHCSSVCCNMYSHCHRAIRAVLSEEKQKWGQICSMHRHTCAHRHKSKKTIASVCPESMKGVGRLDCAALSLATMSPRCMKGAQSWAAGLRQKGLSLCYVITLLCYPSSLTWTKRFSRKINLFLWCRLVLLKFQRLCPHLLPTGLKWCNKAHTVNTKWS